MPIAVKDIFCTEGIETTAGSRILEGYRPPYTATAVRRLADAGARLLGKTNMDEFAMGSSNENSGYGPVLNPWDRERVPGGSSGGSAAAVAGRAAPWAIGTDTGGSIRQPASFCGIVGLKPTYGAVSRYGMIAFASSLDQCGPLTRDVSDAALLLRVIQGRDPCDSTSVGIEGGVALPSRESLEGLRFGVPRELSADAEGIEAGVSEVFERTLGVIRELGGEVDECELPHAAHGLSAYYVLAPAEASANLARYDGVRFGPRADSDGDLIAMYERTRAAGFGAEVKRRIMLGTYALSSGLLRGLLRPRAAGSHEDRERLPGRVRALRLPGHADLADGGLQARGADRRPAGDVHVGLLHGADVAGRHPRDLHPGRPRRARRRRPGAPGGLPDRRPGLRRVRAARCGPRARAGDRLRHQATGDEAAGVSVPEGYEAVIGLEIHVQLSTRTKMFCGCELSFGEEPNTHTCPVCLAHPGVLPTINEQAVRYALQIALALGCEPAARSIFHRKNYFYPDLPKGYQISQYDIPLASGGRLGDVRIHRVHLEEDAAKLIHVGESGRIHGSAASLVDFNRGGTPLVEIVTEPDLRGPAEAREWAQLLRTTIKQLGVSDVNMEEGSLRCDANVSLRRAGAAELGTKTELKNMNSFRFLERGIAAELERQGALLEAGEQVEQETFHFDPQDGGADSAALEGVRARLPLLPGARPGPAGADAGDAERSARGAPRVARRAARALRGRARAAGGDRPPACLRRRARRVLRARSRRVEWRRARARSPTGSPASSWAGCGRPGMGRCDPASSKVSPEALAALAGMVESKQVTTGAARQVLATLVAEGGDPAEIVEREGLAQMSDTGELEAIVERAIEAEPGAAEKVRAGNPKAIGPIVGAVMRETKGTADGGEVTRLIREKLGLG